MEVSQFLNNYLQRKQEDQFLLHLDSLPLSSFPVSDTSVYGVHTRGGLAARSGTEFTWSPQLRNLAEWDWVPFSFKTNMAENADMEGRWVFARFWVFPRPNIKKRFSRTFLMEFLDISGKIKGRCQPPWSYPIFKSQLCERADLQWIPSIRVSLLLLIIFLILHQATIQEVYLSLLRSDNLTRPNLGGKCRDQSDLSSSGKRSN